MEDNQEQVGAATVADASRREAMVAIARVAKYVAPATLVLVSSVGSAGSVQ